MRPIVVLTCLALGACAPAAEPPGVVVLPEHVDLRDGVVLPEAETVTLGGRSYAFTLIPDGGSHAYPGGDHADVVLIGGTGDAMAAVDVFLAECHPGRARVDAWGDEYIPRERVTGAWLFEYPDGCPARGSVPAA